MNEAVSPGPRTLDNGQPFRVGGDGEPAFVAAVCACMVPGCPCTEVELHLTPDADASARPDDDEEAAEPARITVDLATREVTSIVDPAGVLAGDHGEAWIRGEVAGVVGARVAARVARARAQQDRSTWQAYDWARHEPGDMVHHDELFPHDWDLVIVVGGQTVWFSDLYCVRPECACQELVLAVQVLDPDGTWSPGDVRLRLGAKNTVKIASCDRDAARFVEPFLAIPRIGAVLHERYREARWVGRRRQTWASDIAAPDRLIARLVAGRAPLGEDDFERVGVLGERVVAPLVSVVDDETAPAANQLRALHLLSWIRHPGVAEPLARALAREDVRADPALVHDVTHGLTDAGAAALEPLLAVHANAGEARDLVVAALADLRIVDARVLELLSDRARRDPAEWVDSLRWQGAAALPIASGILEAQLAATPFDVRATRAAADVVEALGGEVDRDVLARLDAAERQARDARAAAEATARAALAETDRRLRGSRNGPCWCGSGTKYKKCHLAADEAARQALLVECRSSPQTVSAAR